jgi:hypothetical protein
LITCYRLIEKDIDEAEVIVNAYDNGWKFVMELLMHTHPSTYPRHEVRRLVDPRPDEIPEFEDLLGDMDGAVGNENNVEEAINNDLLDEEIVFDV